MMSILTRATWAVVHILDISGTERHRRFMVTEQNRSCEIDKQKYQLIIRFTRCRFKYV